MSLTFRNKLDRFPTCWKWGRAFYLLKQQHKNNSSYSSFSDSFLFINKDLCENDLFDWNHQIFQRINRQIIRVTQTPLKSLCLLSRKKKKSMHLQSDISPQKPIKQWENFQFLLSMLFPYKEQGTVWGPGTVISILACRLASPVSLSFTVPPGSYTALRHLLASLAALPACLVFSLETLVYLTT